MYLIIVIDWFDKELGLRSVRLVDRTDDPEEALSVGCFYEMDPTVAEVHVTMDEGHV